MMSSSSTTSTPLRTRTADPVDARENIEGNENNNPNPSLRAVTEGSYLVKDNNQYYGRIRARNSMLVQALGLVGTDAPKLEKDAKFIVHQIVAALADGIRWRLFHDDGEADVFPPDKPRPDTYVMDGNVNIMGSTTTKIPSDRAYAECAGILEWQSHNMPESAEQAVEYIEHMFHACPWRENAVVIMVGLQYVRVYIGNSLRNGRHSLRITQTVKRDLVEIDKGKITGFRHGGLALLSWGLLIMCSARLSPIILQRVGLGVGDSPYAMPSGKPGIHAKLVGVGTSSSVCLLKCHGKDKTYCMKTVEQSYRTSFEDELKALKNIPRNDVFPRLVGYDEDTQRLVTTPVATQLCPVVGNDAHDHHRARCTLGFSAYIPLVEAMKTIHLGPKRIYHRDVSIHNLCYYVDKEGKSRVVLIDFGCAVITKKATGFHAPYAGAMLYASSSALNQLVTQEEWPNTWSGTVQVDASFDLEGLAKCIAAMEIPGVVKFIDDESQRIDNERKKKGHWQGYEPKDVVDIWNRAFEGIKLLKGLEVLFEEARAGHHDGMVEELGKLEELEELLDVARRGGEQNLMSLKWMFENVCLGIWNRLKS